MKRVLCSTFANGHSFIDYEHLGLVADEAIKKFQETGEFMYQSISDQLEEILESDIDEADDGVEYAPSDFSGLVKRFIDFCLDPESDVAGHFHDDAEDEYKIGDGLIRVYSITGPFGELVGNDKTFEDGREKEAIEYWLKESVEYPTCTTITGLRYQGQAIHEYVTNNQEEFIDMYSKYKNPYTLDYLLQSCAKPCRQSDKYPDQVHPFCFG